MNFGLVAHRLHRLGPDCTLLRWARLCEADLKTLGLQLHATGGAHDTLVINHLMRDQLVSVGHGHDGGLMRLVSRAAGGLTPENAIDGVFFFIDPVNPTSMYPEAQALKRQCVIHGKPFVATLAGAIEWVAVEMASAGLVAQASPISQQFKALESQVVALIA
ncbi:MAG: methylglyoxal synthase, partial [Pseudomonadota bacterium]